jgi:hypothetical protein
MACHHDRPDMVRLLLDGGVDLTIQNQWGRTPLHVAARRNCDLTAMLLLSRGAAVDATTTEGWTPLHVAQRSGHPLVRDLLLAHGADPERKDGSGKVPADYAFQRPEPEPEESPNLGPYVGRYALGPEVALRVWVERGRLHMAEFGPNELYPIKCHVTGAQDRVSGPADTFRQEEGVGCEACHGPGSAYIDPAIMADREAFLSHGGRIPDESTCRTCHEGERFQYEERVPRVAHPRPAGESGES